MCPKQVLLSSSSHQHQHPHHHPPGHPNHTRNHFTLSLPPRNLPIGPNPECPPKQNRSSRATRTTPRVSAASTKNYTATKWFAPSPKGICQQPNKQSAISAPSSLQTSSVSPTRTSAASVAS